MSQSHHNTHEFVELVHNVTNEHIIVEEFDDYHFDMGYRFIKYVPNSQVYYPQVIEYHENLKLQQLKDSPSDPYIYYESESRVYYDKNGDFVIFEYHNEKDKDKWHQHTDVEIW